jgi:NAD(P)-dependent dehydrogenase (short-subunit alcohol dehydrogenase family)
MGLRTAHEAMAGRIAVVVGGAAGHLGRGVTLGLAGEGMRVVCCDNDREGLAVIAAEAAAAGGSAEPHYADVTDLASLDAFFDRVEANCDRIDVLVNLAGGVARAAFEDTSRASHAADIRLNYGYVIDSCQRAIPLLRASQCGASVINFTTVEAHRGAATFAVYAGAKAATANFSRALAVELGRDRIRVNCVATDTAPARASNAALSPADFARLAELGEDALNRSIEFYVPQKRSPTVEDVVNGVLFLSCDLSRSVTGTTLHIDGGTWAASGWLDWPGGDGWMPAPLGGAGKLLFG